METDVDTCLKDIADWFIKNRQGITMPELEAILMKHCESEDEVKKFVSFLDTEPGQLRFKTLLRERKGGSRSSNPELAYPSHGKRPWQMTLAEYKKTVKPGDRVAWGNHYEYVKQALLDGLKVPPEVLADYPELRKYEIPRTRVASLGFVELELPVARAVEALVNEKPWSSGFHGALNQRWTIVFSGRVSDRAAKAAEIAGLEVAYRPIGSGQIITDVSLPGVGVTEIEKATEAFNRFAELYEGLKGGGIDGTESHGYA